VQEWVHQARPDRLERTLGTRRRVRPHPLLHPGHHGPEAGRGGPDPTRGHRRIVPGCNHQQDSRRLHSLMERRGRGAVWLRREGDDRGIDQTADPPGATGRRRYDSGAASSWRAGGALRDGSGSEGRAPHRCVADYIAASRRCGADLRRFKDRSRRHCQEEG